MSRLSGKVAIVTGAAQGIGAAIAERFAAEGARVCLVDCDAEVGDRAAAQIRGSGGDAVFCRADVSAPDGVDRAVDQAKGREGRIDVLCNNAAYLGEFHDALESTAEEWERSISITLMGTHYFTRAVLPSMVERRAGSIVNVASIQAIVGGRTSAAYTTVKAALLGYTRSVAYDFGRHNVRCNALCPGAITTRISPPPGSELYRRQVENTFLGRTGTPREVASAALFLASDEASYVTGAVVPVDGGWTAH